MSLVVLLLLRFTKLIITWEVTNGCDIKMECLICQRYETLHSNHSVPAVFVGVVTGVANGTFLVIQIHERLEKVLSRISIRGRYIIKGDIQRVSDTLN